MGSSHLIFLSNLWDVWAWLLFVIVLCSLWGTNHSFTPREAVLSGRFWQCFCRNIPTTEQRTKNCWAFPAWDCMCLTLCLSMGQPGTAFLDFVFVCQSFLCLSTCLWTQFKQRDACWCCVVFTAVFRDFLWCPFGWHMGKLPVKCEVKELEPCIFPAHKSPLTSHFLGWSPLQTSVDRPSPDLRSSLRREERFLKWKVPCDEIGEPKRHKLLLDSQPVDKKLRLTLMSERGKNALNPCDTYITSGLGCFSHKGRTSVARGGFRDKSKPVTSENREFPKSKPSGEDRVFHIRLVPLLAAAGCRRYWWLPKLV